MNNSLVAHNGTSYQMPHAFDSEIYDRLTRDEAEGTLTKRTPLTVTSELFDRYERQLDAEPKTIATYSRALKQLKVYFAEHGITEPNRQNIMDFRDSLKVNHKPTTVQAYLIAARLFFRWLESEGLYPNIAEHVKGVKLDRDNKRDYFNADQIKSILNRIDRTTIQGRRDYAILALMVTCGLRTIEVSRANIADLRQLGGITILNIQGKKHEERVDYVKVSATVESIIRASLADRKTVKNTDPLFVSSSNKNTGERLTTRSISRIVKTHLVNAGFNSSTQTAHSLRHTAVTLALLAGKSIYETQEFARHADISTTTIYAHALDKAENTCAQAVTDSIF
jgi:integrase/recombinase XerC